MRLGRGAWCFAAGLAAVAACGSSDGGDGGDPGAGADAGPGGVLDPSFGEGGIWESAEGRFNELSDLAVQADGKIVCAATTKDGFDLQVVRFTTEPLLDLDFGDGGGITAVEYTADSRGHVIVQPDGTVHALAAHAVEGGGADPSAFAVTRLTPDGQLDPSFGSEGRLVVSSPGTNVQLREAVAGPDGSVLVLLADSGGTPDRADDTLWVGQLDADGAPDPDFGSDGWAPLAVPAPPQGLTRALWRRADGRVAAATAIEGGAAAVFQLSADGQPDAGFGDGGVAVLSLPGDEAAQVAYTSVTEDERGRLIVAGSDYGGISEQHLLVWRLDDGGSADPAFGAAGLADVTTQGGSLGDIVADPRGGLLTLSTRNSYGGATDEVRLVLSRFDDAGAVTGELELDPLVTNHQRLAVLADGTYLLMWGGYHGKGLARVVPFAD